MCSLPVDFPFYFLFVSQLIASGLWVMLYDWGQSPGIPWTWWIRLRLQVAFSVSCLAPESLASPVVAATQQSAPSASGLGKSLGELERWSQAGQSWREPRKVVDQSVCSGGNLKGRWVCVGKPGLGCHALGSLPHGVFQVCCLLLSILPEQINGFSSSTYFKTEFSKVMLLLKMWTNDSLLLEVGIS